MLKNRRSIIDLCALLVCSCALFAEPYPIQFSISESKIVRDIPQKDRDFAFIVAGDLSTYIYDFEEDYYRDYQRSYFAVTKLKGGWDCMRHYEILANGCIPYFLDLESCPPKTMVLLPKELILEAMHLPGVSYLHIDHSVFDEKRYQEILSELLEYTRNILSSRSMAHYILDTVDYKGEGKILYLSEDLHTDYLRCCTLIGLKEAFGERVIDDPKVEHIYQSYPHDIRKLSNGKGFSYAKIIEDLPIDREDIEQRILNKEFELIIYGSVHRGLRYYDAVHQTYEPGEIIYLCGEDIHECGVKNWPNLFLREIPNTF